MNNEEFASAVNAQLKNESYEDAKEKHARARIPAELKRGKSIDRIRTDILMGDYGKDDESQKIALKVLKEQ